MIEVANYSAIERLRTGREVEIRALHAEDCAELLAAFERLSEQTIYRRFFGAKRVLTGEEISFFVNVDFASHVALVAVFEENGRTAIVGGARYVVTVPGQAELAFAVIDQYQGQGIGRALMRHLVAIARGAGLCKLIAEVLPDNLAMLKVFASSGLCLRVSRQNQTVHISLQLL